MKVSRKLQAALDQVLEPGEDVVGVSFAEVKEGSAAKRLAKDLGVSLVASAAASVVGLNVMRGTMPPLVWVVVTRERMLMLARPDGPRSAGDLVFDIPVEQVALRLETAALKAHVVVSDAASGDDVMRLHFGMRKGDASRIAEAGGSLKPA